MSVVVEADFVGDVRLRVSTNQSADLQACIDRIEKKYLIDLLGYDLYVVFLAGIAGTQYLKLSAGYKDFLGLKAMLKYIIYAEWISTANIFTSVNGLSANQAENATALNQAQINQHYDRAYNKGIDIYRSAIEWIEEQNASEPITSVSGVTVYTEDTKILANGMTVTINDTEYTVSNLVADTSFDTNVAVGSATEWEKEFYADFEYIQKDFSVFAGSL